MLFTNSAFMTYNGKTVGSNTVTGEVMPPLSLSKAASAAAYTPGGELQYSVTVVNTSPSAYTGLTLLDDLGKYDFGGFPRFPLSYIDASAALTLFGAGSVTPGSVTAVDNSDGVLFTFDIPAETSALLTYRTDVTVFAPPAAGSVITNTVLLNGNVPLLPLKYSLTLPVMLAADPAIAKYTDSTATVGQPFTFAFIVSNYGNTAVTAADFTALADTFDPPLTGITVYADGVLWTEGVQYLFDGSTGYFQTQYGAILLPPATFTQDSFGSWNASPSSTVITVTGTVAR